MKTIIISGLVASGKTTLGKHLADKLKIQFYDGGHILKMLAREKGYNPSGVSWWDTEDGLRFLAERHKDSNFDKAVDAKFLNILAREKCVVTSRTMPWLHKGDAIKIWLFASTQARAHRMAVRDGIDDKKALEIMRDRDVGEAALYKRLYGIDFGNDLKPFDIVINSTNMTRDEVAKEVEKRIRELA